MKNTTSNDEPTGPYVLALLVILLLTFLAVGYSDWIDGVKKPIPIVLEEK